MKKLSNEELEKIKAAKNAVAISQNKEGLVRVSNGNSATVLSDSEVSAILSGETKEEQREEVKETPAPETKEEQQPGTTVTTNETGQTVITKPEAE